MVEGAALEKRCVAKTAPGVRISPSPPERNFFRKLSASSALFLCSHAVRARCFLGGNEILPFVKRTAFLFSGKIEMHTN